MVRWAAGCVSLFFVVGCGGAVPYVWCYRIGFSMWALSMLFSDTFILLYSTVNSTGSRAVGVAKMQFIVVAS